MYHRLLLAPLRLAEGERPIKLRSGRFAKEVVSVLEEWYAPIRHLFCCDRWMIVHRSLGRNLKHPKVLRDVTTFSCNT